MFISQWKIIHTLFVRTKKQFNFSNNDINKFILLLRNGIYPYEYMD